MRITSPLCSFVPGFLSTMSALGTWERAITTKMAAGVKSGKVFVITRVIAEDIISKRWDSDLP